LWSQLGKEPQEGGLQSRPARQDTRPYLKNKVKRAVRVAQVEERLPSNHEVLSSNPSTGGKKK
jgi:hypothetical protein